jgi:fluoride ion exporter CrcB/FEX
MQPIYVSSLIFLIVFGGAALGMFLRRLLPEEHFSQDARTVVSLSTGVVVTMTGLVLGMLVSSAKSSYDAQRIPGSSS